MQWAEFGSPPNFLCNVRLTSLNISSAASRRVVDAPAISQTVCTCLANNDEHKHHGNRCHLTKI